MSDLTLGTKLTLDKETPYHKCYSVGGAEEKKYVCEPEVLPTGVASIVSGTPDFKPLAGDNIQINDQDGYLITGFNKGDGDIYQAFKIRSKEKDTSAIYVEECPRPDQTCPSQQTMQSNLRAALQPKTMFNFGAATCSDAIISQSDTPENPDMPRTMDMHYGINPYQCMPGDLRDRCLTSDTRFPSACSDEAFPDKMTFKVA